MAVWGVVIICASGFSRLQKTWFHAYTCRSQCDLDERVSKKRIKACVSCVYMHKLSKGHPSALIPNLVLATRDSVELLRTVIPFFPHKCVNCMSVPLFAVPI